MPVLYFWYIDFLPAFRIESTCIMQKIEYHMMRLWHICFRLMPAFVPVAFRPPASPKKMIFEGLKKLLFSVTILAAILSGCSSDFEKGEACLQLGDYEMAITFFGKALYRNPKNIQARRGMGKALLQRSVATGDTADWAQALINLEAARSLSGVSQIDGILSEAWAGRARHFLAQNDTIQALAALSRAIELNPRALEAINLAGIVYNRLGSIGKSEALFRKAIAIDSTNASGYFNTGMVCWQKQEYKQAHAHWLKALRYAPDDNDILYWFALVEKALREGAAP